MQEWEADWRILETIGDGGQGSTHKAESISDPSRIGVLKTLKKPKDPIARGRMAVEAGSLDTLSKQGLKVPHVLATNTEKINVIGTDLYFVMEYIPGTTLKKEIRERGPQSLETAAQLTKDLCATVAEAHARGVIHRDIKPDNVIVRGFDPADLIIVDYGLSFNREATSESDLTADDEQIRNSFIALPETNTPGGDRRDARSDVTALCGMLYFFLTTHYPGQLLDAKNRPPHRRSGYSVREALGTDPCCEDIEVLLDQGFQVDPDLRFQNVTELVARLDLTMSGAPRPKKSIEALAEELALKVRRENPKTFVASSLDALNKLTQFLIKKIDELGSRSNRLTRNTVSAFSAPKTPIEGIDSVIDQMHGFTLTLQHHAPKCGIAFTIGSRGRQCVLLAALMHRHFAVPFVDMKWRQLKWFDPHNIGPMEKYWDPLEAVVEDGLRYLADAPDEQAEPV